ncbi:MAG TPA: SRPBCC family protein [Acidobacteriota bacterium]|nr:SRPBCC family protein [Acidobacteriota bacterium]
MKNSVTLHRVFKTSPEKIYRAFTTAQALASWLPPYGFFCTVHQFDAKVGGKYKMSFSNFTTDKSHSFGGTFLELKVNELVKHTDVFDDLHMPGELITTIKIKKVLVGTQVDITQEGIPPMIPVEACYLGWQESLEKLAKLVEPDIPQ